jgi:hypothetical protein
MFANYSPENENTSGARWNVPEVRSLSLTADALADEDLQHCQKVGSSVERLGHDGLLVPSARAKGTNLVIFPNRTVEGVYRFEVIDAEVVDPGMRW